MKEEDLVFPALMMVWKEEKNKDKPLMGVKRLVLGKNLQGYIVVLGSDGSTVVDKNSNHTVYHCEYAEVIL